MFGSAAGSEEAHEDDSLTSHAWRIVETRGVLFHWWPFSSKRNDELQLFYTEYKPNMSVKTTITLMTLLRLSEGSSVITGGTHWQRAGLLSA